MSENPNQPREGDAVLGGAVIPSEGALVLGGLEGIKQRLASEVIEYQISALREAVNYGKAGLDLIIIVFQNRSGELYRTAYALLQKSSDPKAKQAMRDRKREGY